MCGSWLACDADTSVYQLDRGDAIAGKPATQASPHTLGNGAIHQHLRLFHQALEVIFANKALGIDLVDILGA